MTRTASAAAALLAAGTITACSVRPQYMVRVENNSSSTVIARISRDVSFEDDEVLAQQRVRPNAEITLGPVTADPLQPVELLVSLSGDLHALPEKYRLSRGSWVASLTDAPVSTWTPFHVQLSKTSDPIPKAGTNTETPAPSAD